MVVAEKTKLRIIKSAAKIIADNGYDGASLRTITENEGEYIACFEDKEVVLKPGDELYVPKETIQWGRCKAGTITISAFGGKRIVTKSIDTEA
jgi:hypothetical protein